MQSPTVKVDRLYRQSRQPEHLWAETPAVRFEDIRANCRNTLHQKWNLRQLREGFHLTPNVFQLASSRLTSHAFYTGNGWRCCSCCFGIAPRTKMLKIAAYNQLSTMQYRQPRKPEHLSAESHAELCNHGSTVKYHIHDFNQLKKSQHIAITGSPLW